MDEHTHKSKYGGKGINTRRDTHTKGHTNGKTYIRGGHKYGETNRKKDIHMGGDIHGRTYTEG